VRDWPATITTGTDGNLWFTVPYYGRSSIARMTTSGAVDEFLIDASNAMPSRITVGPDGNLWFGRWYGDSIGRITTAGRITDFNIVSDNSGAPVQGITSGPDGNLWFTVWFQDEVFRSPTDPAPPPTPVPAATHGGQLGVAGAAVALRDRRRSPAARPLPL
jgi:virginiamycin B lyase